MSTFGNFISVAKAQILTNSTFVTSSDNIILSNNVDILGLPDTAFPRIEIYVDSAKGSGYNSQRDLNWNFSWWFVGYIRRTTKEQNADYIWSESDFLNIWDFGVETMSTVLGLLDYKQANPSALTGFQYFEGDPEIYVECELMPYISTFMGKVNPYFIKGDTDE